MSVKTLSEIQTLGPASLGFRRHTYSISPIVATPASAGATLPASDLEIALDGENPLGCARGVFFVMAFNAGVALLGFLIWQSIKYL
jgi:hypothetical protein